MKIVNINVGKLKPGMIIFEDVINLSGAIILTKDSILDDNSITKLKSNNVEKVKIFFADSLTGIDNLNAVYNKEKVEIFQRSYDEKVDEITDILKSIGRGDNVEIDEIKNISLKIVNEFDILSDLLNFMNVLKPLDDLTFAHSLNVSIISIVIGNWLGMSEDDLSDLATAGLLHDVGKTQIDEKILEKPSKLTTEEFEEMKKHPALGYKMVENMVGVNDNIRNSVLMHHERIDGSGYPLSLKDEGIPLLPKIIAIADIYDAMTSNRPYRDKMCPFDVIRDFEMHTFGKLDTKALTTFLSNIANSYKGDFVELSNGEIGEVVFINPNRVWQPIIRVGEEFVDLSTSKEISIKEII